MKKFLITSLAFAIAINASEEPKPIDPTEQYRNKKANEAIIHDAYYEAEEYKEEIPVAWKEALEAFGFKHGDINFYTTVRINKFVERVGNSLVILRPNFFLYLTPEEQKAYIGLQLASFKQGIKNDVGCSHGTFYESKTTDFQKATIGLTALGLAALYHKQIMEKSRQYGPTLKNVIFSKAVGLIAGCWLLNKAKDLAKEHEDIKAFNEAQFEVIDKLGSQGLLSIREKQVNWSKLNSWWLERKWHYMLGKLSLAYSPEANYELINEYISKKNAAAN